ncbi:MAG: hypothetical protein EOP05_05415 [Proteobacteria bacterium]|nr:MAG: hypothetical protein EOP05_05415 [Pseudomonadota bacterium]
MGRYIVVTCNSASNENDLYIYKADFDAGGGFQKATLLHAVDAGSSHYQSHLVIDLTESE